MEKYRVFNTKNRILALILVVVMSFQLVSNYIPGSYAANEPVVLNMASVSQDVYIYTSLRFNQAGTVETGTGSYKLTGDTTNYNTVIGNGSLSGTDYTGDSDISVDLSGVSITQDKGITVNPIGTTGSYCGVNFTVSSDSKVANLTVKEHGNVTIEMSADLVLGDVVLEDYSSLTINTNGNNISINSITSNDTSGSSGTSTFTVGGSNVSFVGDIKVDNIIFNAAIVTGSESNSVAAYQSIIIHNTTVSNLGLLGIEDTVKGSKTVTLTGVNNFSNISAIGVSESGLASVTISGANTISSSTNVNYYSDDNIVYQCQGNTLTPDTDWPVTYRVKRAGSYGNGTNTVVGSHTSDGTYTQGTVTLPSYTVAGHGYSGWNVGSDANVYTALPNGISGEINLSVVLEAGEITMTFDRGYTPTEYTNDDTSLTKTWVENHTLGDNITLTTPTRFGYTFTGWKVTTGSLNGTHTGSYTLAIEDADENQGVYSITMEAQWTANSYPLRLMITGTNTSTAKVTVNGTTYNSITDFANAYSDITWDSSYSMLSFDKPIKYGETIQTFLERNGLNSLPTIIDNDGQVFKGWVNTDHENINLNTTFTIGDMLDNGSQTLEDYDASISTNPVFLRTTWGSATNNLTVDVVSGWDILINGVVQDLGSGTTKTFEVTKDTEITWRQSKSVEGSLSMWSFATDASFVTPQEQTYDSSSSYNYYVTTMPSDNLTATYSSSTVYIDISKSDITFEGSTGSEYTLPSGRTTVGFWYDIDMTTQNSSEKTYTDSDGVTIAVNEFTPIYQDSSTGKYFYELTGSSDTTSVYITSRNEETTNQLNIISARNIYLRDCKMVARSQFSTNFVNRKAYTVRIEHDSNGAGNLNKAKLMKKDWSENGNIVIENQYSDGSANRYITNLHVLGSNNTIAQIIQGNCRPEGEYTQQSESLCISGENQNNTQLELGNITYLGFVDISNITVNEYDNTEHSSNLNNSDYLIYTSSSKESADRIYISNSNINAKNKRLYDGFGNIYIKGSSNVNIESTKSYNVFYIQDNSYVHVYGDIYAIRSPLNMNSNTCVVVDGNIISRCSNSVNSAYHGSVTFSSTGYLIVKGNMIYTAVFSKSGAGTVVANTICASRYYTITNGNIITNQILNQVVGYPTIDGNGYYTTTDITNLSSNWKMSGYSIAPNARNNANGDNFPYANVAYYYTSTDTYKISGGYTFLYGDYDVSDTVSSYDYSRVLWSKTSGYSDNEVAQFLKDLAILDLNGDLIESRRPAAYVAKTNTQRNNEISALRTLAKNDLPDYGSEASKHHTIQVGSTRFNGENGSPCYRTVSFTGGYFYSAGSAIYANDMTVSGGTIQCAGVFGSKRDITVTGGDITAKEVGNTCQIDKVATGSILRHQELNISGGTINTGRLGALSTLLNDDSNNESKSTIYITGAFTLKTATATTGTVEVVNDEKINYVYDSEFNVSSTTPDTVRHEGSILTGSITTIGTSLLADSETTLPAVSVSGGTAKWRYDSLSGTDVSSISENGYLDGDTSKPCVYEEKEYAAFYAVKDTYTLTLKEGKIYASYYTVNSKKHYFDLNSTVNTADVQADSTVTLKLEDESMYEKVVVWYKDPSGIYHNAMVGGNVSSDGTITFIMPANNTDVYITDKFNLYLNEYNISLIEDGFAVEIPSDSRIDSAFAYKGNICITENASTNNLIKFEENSGNLNDDGSTSRTIEYSGLNQSITSQNDYGTTINAGEKVQIDLASGENIIAPIYLPGGDTNPATLVIKGKGQTVAKDRDQSKLKINIKQAFNSYAAITAGSTCGNVTLQDLTITNTGNTGNPETIKLASSGSSSRFCDLILKNVAWTTAWSSGYSVGYYMNSVTFDDCDIKFTGGTSYTSYPVVANYFNVINGTTFNYTYGGQYGGYSMWYNVSKKMTISDSTVSCKTNNSASNTPNWENTGVGYTLEINDSDVTLANQTRLLSLTVNGASKVDIGAAQDGFLMAETINVNSTTSGVPTINAGYVIVAGMSYASSNSNGSITYSTQEAFYSDAVILKNIRNGNSSSSYRGLVLNGGTINATEFVGGDYNGKVTVNDGTINSKKIGTYGALFGYKEPMVKDGETDYTYIYYTKPIAGTVTVNGGEINVADDGYLGGINGTVNITGGTVNIGDNAVIGITKNHQTELETEASSTQGNISNPVILNITGGTISGGSLNSETGSISAPYSTVNISGASTTVNVKDLNADYGTINISDTNDAFDNPYTGTDLVSEASKVGVYVSGTTQAQYINILDDASVFSYNIYAVIDENGDGYLRVPDDGGYLTSTGSYGEKNIARAEADKLYNDTLGDPDRNVFGRKIANITYILNNDAVIFKEDEKTIVNNNITSYIVTSTAGFLTIEDASCQGYVFEGWYVNSNYSGDVVTQISTMNSNDLTLYAKWSKINVKFALVMDSNSPNYSESEFTSLTTWTPYSGGGYIITNSVGINYGDKILGSNAVNFSNYKTNTLGVTEVEIMTTQGTEIYTGSTTVETSTTVSKDLAELYRTLSSADSSAVIVLHVTNVQKRYARITFSVNKKNGKPIDATIDGSESIKADVSVDNSIGSSSVFADSSVTDGKSPGLKKAIATGYTFIGWNTNSSATKDSTDGWVTATGSYFTESTTVYAIWQANTYLVRFSSGIGSWVTSESTEPLIGAATVDYLDYYWIYDTSITEDNSFWLKDQSGVSLTELPYAWAEGYTFNHHDGWTYSYDDNGTTVTDSITSTGELSALAILALDASIYSSDQQPTQPALILTATYEKVVVNYDLNDGSWAGTKPTSTPDYKAALAGYKSNVSDSTDYNKLAEVSNTFSATETIVYDVISTTSSYYDTNKSLVSGDYREVLGRKGYTFLGWYDSETKAENAGSTGDTSLAIATTPRFSDKTLYAAWKANTYNLDLYSAKDGQIYSYTSFANSSAKTTPVEISNVTVGEEINSSDWPKRSDGSDWYAYNSSIDSSNIQANQKRYLLGFTFGSLDPGSTDKESAGYSIYNNYAQYVTAMQNTTTGSTLFQTASATNTGTTFYLPEDSVYGASIGNNSFKIVDYPNGCTIDLYSVYRERSLVFVERYIDTRGEVQEKVMYSGAWNAYSTYPNTYKGGTSYNNIVAQGYSLIGWYINGTTTAATKYTDEATYQANCESYKADAATLETYDIMVYTVYAAQVTRNITLTTKTDPRDTSHSSDSYKLPKSMQSGTLSLSNTLGTGLNIVTKEEMINHQYDSSWTSGGNIYTADNTVAILLTITDGTVSYTYDLADINTGKLVAAGWTTTLTLYHSKVITTNDDFNITTQLNFSNSDGGSENTLKDQWIKNNITIDMKPTVYNVNYTITLPEDPEDITVSDWGDFSEVTNTRTVTLSNDISYGSDLTSLIPEIEGYKWTSTKTVESTEKNGWLSSGDSTIYTTLTVPVTEDNAGVVNISGTYTAKKYLFKPDSETISHWTITYTDGAESSSVTTINSSDAGNELEVKYHSVITFTTVDSTPAEYVTLKHYQNEKTTLTSKDKVADYTDYTFSMPAEAMIATEYITVETLYLDDGTISITESGYTMVKNDSTVVNITWPGDYIILQCEDNNSDNHETANTLSLEGDLSSREINIGTLNITSADSITLVNGTSTDSTKVNLKFNYNGEESTITAKNILVPQYSELTALTGLSDTSKIATINLEPATNTAAIGAATSSPINGKIDLSYLDISTKMEAPSVASGIGAGNQNQTLAAGSVAISNCTFTMDERTSPAGQYTGSWIGGVGCSTVNISNTAVSKDTYSQLMVGPSVVSGKTVNITDSTIGSPGTGAINDPVYAVNVLNITNTDIYQSIQNNLNNNALAISPIGTSDSGTINVTDSNIYSEKGGLAEYDKLYTGMMLLDTPSDVIIGGVCILEASNGSISITDASATQDTKTHTHSGNYMVIEEKSTLADPNLTVNVTNRTVTVIINEPTKTTTNSAALNNDEVVINNLTANSSMKLKLEGDLKVANTGTIGTDKTLTVNADAGYGISFTGSLAAFGDSQGKYIQNNGYISVTNDFGGKDLDVELTSTTTTAKNIYAKDLTISGGTVTANASGSKVGSLGSSTEVTNVNISDSAVVNADTIGALGAHNTTFTFVTLSDNENVTGKVVADLYRIAYDVGSAKLTTDSLVKVLRTETLYNAGTAGSVTYKYSVPDNPTGNDAALFDCWYIWNDAGVSRRGIKQDTNAELIAGVSEWTNLTDATINEAYSGDRTANSDGTTTITLHAWLKATGVVTIKQGRVFNYFSDSTTNVTIQTNGVFTAQLVSTGNNISGRDYKVTFGKALPKGCDLTLTIPDTNGVNSYYYYTVTDNAGITSIKFSDFVTMGTTSTSAPELTTTTADNETFLLAVDFKDANDISKIQAADFANTTVKFELLPTATSTVDMDEPAKFSMSQVIDGTITASSTNVTVTELPSGDSSLSGNNLYLMAVLTDTNGEDIRVPISAEGTLTLGSDSIAGTWISGNTILFNIGAYGSNAISTNARSVSFENLEADTYNITWQLVYGQAANDNILGNVISNQASGSYTVTEVSVTGLDGVPWLLVTNDKSSIVLEQGQAHTLTYNYQTSASKIVVVIEKQVSLGTYSEVSGSSKTIDVSSISGITNVTLDSSLEKGAYRVHFSMYDSAYQLLSQEDDIYFTYIIE